MCYFLFCRLCFLIFNHFIIALPPPSSHPRIIKDLQTVSFTFPLTTSSNNQQFQRNGEARSLVSWRNSSSSSLSRKIEFCFLLVINICSSFFPLALQHTSQISQNVLAASSALALRLRRASLRPLPLSRLPPLHPLAAHPPLLKCQRSSGVARSVQPCIISFTCIL